MTEQILAGIPCTLVYSSGFLFQKDVDFGLQVLPGTSLGLYYRFREVIDSLWLLWELVLLGEPIQVTG